MRAVFAITDYSVGSKLNDIFVHENIPFRLLTHGHGSAESEWLELLGLGENKKAVVISVTRKENVAHLYKRLDREMNIRRAGTGIAFSVPINSISAAVTKMYNYDAAKNAQNVEKESQMSVETPYELIITIVSRGYFETVKNAAREAGARGGTVIHGLGIGGEEAAKFLGINLQPEKDIVLMVVNAEDKQLVMRKITEKAGILKESRGVCFSLPVDSAFGLAEKFIDDELEDIK